MSIKHQLKRGINCLVAQLRKVNIFPRLLLVFSTLLIASTVFITFFNQKNYAAEAETNAVKYLSILVQNASLELVQEKEQIELGLLPFIQNENVLHAISENNELYGSEQPDDVKTQEKMRKNRYMIEQTLRSVKNNVNGVKAALFVTENAQYQMLAEKEGASTPYIRNLDEFHKSEIYQKAVAAQGYPSWRDSVKDTSNLIYENKMVHRIAFNDIDNLLRQHFRIQRIENRCCVHPSHCNNAIKMHNVTEINCQCRQNHTNACAEYQQQHHRNGE